MKHDVVVIDSNGEQLHARDIEPRQLFEMYASAAVRLERIEIALAETAMLLLHHLGEAPSPSDGDTSEVVADLKLMLAEIRDVMQLAQAARQHMDFLNSRE